MWCWCSAFKYWYTDDDGPVLKVCRCGHTTIEHLDGKGSCLGVLMPDEKYPTYHTWLYEHKQGDRYGNDAAL